MNAGQITSAGRWVVRGDNPNIVQWYDGSALTQISGTPENIHSMLAEARELNGIEEPVRSVEETIASPSKGDREILEAALNVIAAEAEKAERARLKSLVENSAEGKFDAGWYLADPDDTYTLYWNGTCFSHKLPVSVVAQNNGAPPQGAVTPVSVPPASAVQPSVPVSNASAPENPDSIGWYADPDDPKCLIKWDGDEWSDRMTLKQAISNALDSAGIGMPEAWNIEHSHSRRDRAIMDLLIQMCQGAGWFRDPESDFYDLKVRWWDSKQWTESTAADPAGWYDAPNDSSKLQWWSGREWTENFLNKEEVRMQEEKKQTAKDARKQFVVGALMAGVNELVKVPTYEEKQASKAAAARESERQSDRWERDRIHSQQREAARQQAKFYRKANDRRGW